MTLILQILNALGLLKLDFITPEEAAREIIAKEVQFQWKPQIVEIVKEPDGSR